jgi:hypothetical protein
MHTLRIAKSPRLHILCMMIFIFQAMPSTKRKQPEAEEQVTKKPRKAATAETKERSYQKNMIGACRSYAHAHGRWPFFDEVAAYMISYLRAMPASYDGRGLRLADAALRALCAEVYEVECMLREDGSSCGADVPMPYAIVDILRAIARAVCTTMLPVSDRCKQAVTDRVVPLTPEPVDVAYVDRVQRIRTGQYRTRKRFLRVANATDGIALEEVRAARVVPFSLFGCMRAMRQAAQQLAAVNTANVDEFCEYAMTTEALAWCSALPADDVCTTLYTSQLEYMACTPRLWDPSANMFVEQSGPGERREEDPLDTAYFRFTSVAEARNQAQREKHPAMSWMQDDKQASIAHANLRARDMQCGAVIVARFALDQVAGAPTDDDEEDDEEKAPVPVAMDIDTEQARPAKKTPLMLRIKRPDFVPRAPLLPDRVVPPTEQCSHCGRYDGIMEQCQQCCKQWEHTGPACADTVPLTGLTCAHCLALRARIFSC